MAAETSQTLDRGLRILDLLAVAPSGLTVAELATDLGHDSFLLESAELYALVRGFLERSETFVFDFAI